jgi:hypothetical protein
MDQSITVKRAVSAAQGASVRNGKSAKVTRGWEEFDPERAEKTLDESNVDNRCISTDRAIRYATEMESGAWREDNEQALMFDWDGKLMNGAHRLAAVMLSKTTQRFWVIRGLDPELRKVVDQGKSRSLLDALNMAGHHGGGNHYVAAIKKVYACTPTMHRIYWTADTFEEAEKAVGPSVRALEDFFNATRRGLTRSIMWALCAKALDYLDHSVVEEFLQIFLTGESKGRAKDRSVIKLRDYFLEQAGIKGRALDEKLLYQKSQAVLQAFADGRVLTKLYATEGDLYPLKKSRVPEKIRDCAKISPMKRIEIQERLKSLDAVKRKKGQSDTTT